MEQSLRQCLQQQELLELDHLQVALLALLVQALLVPGLLGLLPLPIWLLLMARLVLELVQEPPPGLVVPVH
jgi:hypothetical protein